MIKHNTFFSNIFCEPEIFSYQLNRKTSLENFIKTEQLTNYPLIQMHQVHGNKIKTLYESQTKKPINSYIYDNVDALITNIPKIILVTKTADCLPILIYHPKNYIAAIHAGRKGTELKIIQEVIKEMIKTTNSNENYKFWLGPAICKKCYQIDALKNLHFDLKGECTKQISEILSLKKNQIFDSGFCTSCNNDTFFSYRKDNKTKNRIYSIIGIK